MQLVFTYTQVVETGQLVPPRRDAPSLHNECQIRKESQQRHSAWDISNAE